MKFNIAAAAIAGGVGFAIALGIAGVIAMFVEGYGSVFLDMMASIYPGYKANGTVGRSHYWLLLRSYRWHYCPWRACIAL